MEEWIYRIITARDPDWRNFPREPMTAARGAGRGNTDTNRRER